MTDAILTTTDIRAGYGKVRILNGLSLSVGRNEIVAMLGVNGSGKSTALKTIMGLTQVSGGAIIYDGSDIVAQTTHWRAGAGLGYVPQRQNVFADLSVDDNLRMGAFLEPGRVKSEMPRILDLFPRLAERKRSIAGSLSGGERRMLSIAMTLLLQPRLLLLDEPSSDLAPAMVQTVADAIARLHSEFALPVLLVEQNAEMALALADRVLVLARGAVSAELDRETAARTDLHALFMESAADQAVG